MRDCRICREFHQDDGEPCPADMLVTIERGAVRIEVPLCVECADEGINLNALIEEVQTP